MTAAVRGTPGRIGLLVKRFPKLSETFILEEVLGLERLGVDLRLYALEPPSDTIVHPDVARVRARPVTLPAGQTTADRAAWLAERLRADGVTHLHTHFIAAPADVGLQAAALAGLPCSISAHAKDIYLSAPEDLARKLRAARFTVTCTEFNRATLAALAPDAVVHRMYHGIDHGAFHPSRRCCAGAGAGAGAPPLLLSVGRLVPKKGLDTLVDACALLRDRGQPFRCEIVGYGEARDALLARIAQHRLADRVQLAGTLARDGVLARYAQAAVYVQPSRITADGDRDGIPNVLLEAMAMGLPVVASAVSGIPELVRDGVNGRLVPPDDAAALADAIATLLAQPATGASLGRAARQTVTADFDNDRNLRLLLRLLENPHACHAEPAAA